MTRWFRHYEGMVDDPKLYVISRKAGLPWPHIAFVWSLILESAARINRGGVFELNSTSVAIKMECTTMDVDTILAEFEAEHMIEKRRDVTVTSPIVTAVTKWCERQFEGDKSAERMRRLRERRKSNPQSGNGKSAPSIVTSRDATVTSRDAPENREERETRTSTVEGSLRSPSTSEGADAPLADEKPKAEKPKREKPTPYPMSPEEEARWRAADVRYYARCKEVFGDRAYGPIGTKLLATKNGVHALAQAVVEMASTKAGPREYVEAVIRGRSEEQRAERHYIDPRLGA